jgi:predicted GNAT family acetyltransferase
VGYAKGGSRDCMSGQAVENEKYSRLDEPCAITVCEAGVDDREEVLAFLSNRPIHTFGMIGMIVANGLVSPNNRGTFYLCRDSEERLEGVALIGYDNLFEANSEAAIRAFARLFHQNKRPHLVMGEEEKIDTFCHYFGPYETLRAVSHRYILYKQNWPIEVCEPIENLRPARREDLDLVVRAHAQAGLEETGVNNLLQDPAGFTRRCVNRIDNQNTWIWVVKNKLIFKVEIITATPEVHYLESVWIDPQERKKGYGLRCLAQLGRQLLQRTSAICLLASEMNYPARALYEKAGYKKLGYYRVLFFPPQTNP